MMFKELAEVLEGDLAETVDRFRINLIKEHGKTGKTLFQGERLIAPIEEVNQVLVPTGTLVSVNGQIGRIDGHGLWSASVNGQWVSYQSLTILEVKEVTIKSISTAGFDCSLGPIKTDKLSEVLQAMRDGKCVTIYNFEGNWYYYDNV